MDKTTPSSIECEIRGPITWSDFCEIKSLLEEEFGRLRHTRELEVFIKSAQDLRLKLTPKGCILIFKKRIEGKKWSKFENEIKFPLTQLKNVLILLDNFGYKEGFFLFVINMRLKKDRFQFLSSLTQKLEIFLKSNR